MKCKKEVDEVLGNRNILKIIHLPKRDFMNHILNNPIWIDKVIEIPLARKIFFKTV